jgi:hypothetical protein
MPGIQGNSDPADDNRRTASLAGAAATLFIVLLALVIARKLQVRCLIENCIFAGGSHCEHVADNLRVSRSIHGLIVGAQSWLLAHLGADGH